MAITYTVFAPGDQSNGAVSHRPLPEAWIKSAGTIGLVASPTQIDGPADVRIVHDGALKLDMKTKATDLGVASLVAIAANSIEWYHVPQGQSRFFGVG